MNGCRLLPLLPLLFCFLECQALSSVPGWDHRLLNRLEHVLPREVFNEQTGASDLGALDARLKALASEDPRNYQPVNELRRVLKRFENLPSGLYVLLLARVRNEIKGLKSRLGDLETMDTQERSRLERDNQVYYERQRNLISRFVPSLPGGVSSTRAANSTTISGGAMEFLFRDPTGRLSWVKTRSTTLIRPPDATQEEFLQAVEYFTGEIPEVDSYLSSLHSPR